MSDTLGSGFKTTPYWWDVTPLDTSEPPDLPNEADVVVVGSGYTGLHAALPIARDGRSVVVLESGPPGHGCSTRNGGQISQSVKPDLKTMTARHGEATARKILSDGIASRQFVEEFVATENLKCGFETCGRFHAAHSPRALGALKSQVSTQPDGFETPATVVDPANQRSEIGSDYYHGGVVFHDHAALDPGRYHAGLLALVRRAGATVCPSTKAIEMSTNGNGVTITTDRGQIQAREAVLATNGYSGKLSPWHQRRIIPIGSYMIATEELPTELMDKFFPKNRIVSDTRKVVYYYRASPDRRRILFGGRVSGAEIGPEKSAERLMQELVRIFPDLAGFRVSHSWMGYVGYTFDTLAHAGQDGPVHYAMGYCGSGVGMASYLGMKTGLQVLGQTESETGLGQIAFPTRPLYKGKPWFLPAAVEYYRLRDRLGI